VIHRYMLDTNMVSYIVKGKSLAARMALAGLKPNEIGCISAITEAEVRYGLAKMPADSLRRSAIEGFLAKLQILPWGSSEAATYGELRVRQESSGKRLESLDMLIAAHAITVGAILVTNDRAFRQIRELPGIVNWATDL
jgi:tRNA(fMet)-specific endonuclease VapC